MIKEWIKFNKIKPGEWFGYTDIREKKDVLYMKVNKINHTDDTALQLTDGFGSSAGNLSSFTDRMSVFPVRMPFSYYYGEITRLRRLKSEHLSHYDKIMPGETFGYKNEISQRVHLKLDKYKGLSSVVIFGKPIGGIYLKDEWYTAKSFFKISFPIIRHVSHDEYLMICNHEGGLT